ncbi:hypothetical protein GCM10022223_65630 [Kineosporia mesophila]|uniref:Type IV pilus assembly protein PilN n=1 Tax=Kineosporia mesophila TaxID=566012 RepID=A0ABP7APX3_9ACTN|nr:PilN domain-containing protein [Kineosporia mesophila]MCD5349185.1 hypothetical protein [Kineosporia mesophila]
MSESTTEVPPAVATGPKPVSWAPVPKVNLLPVEILEDRSFRRTQLVLIGVVVLVVGAIAAGTVIEKRAVDDAQAEADAAQGRVTVLQQQQSEYAEVPKIYAQVEAATAARKQAYVGDAPWYRYLRELDKARPGEVEFTSVVMTLSVAGALPVNPLTPVASASLSIEGTSPDYRRVAQWMDNFDAVPGLQSATLANAAQPDEDGAETTFSTTGVVGASALSGRYQTDDDQPATQDSQSSTS